MSNAQIIAQGRAQPYTHDFFRALGDGARRSAREIVPLILDLVRPASVVDLGCGAGIWLSVFREAGVADVVGVDGDYITREKLEIPETLFRPHDLTTPFYLDRRFDLALSLEVAEHLPESCATQLVASLTRLSPVVLFSAAIPFQGGTHHVNEQWQDYWARHFQDRGYVAVDCVRPQAWQNERVEYWYAQNTLLYVEASYLGDHATLQAAAQRPAMLPLAVVHPRRYQEVIALLDWPRKIIPPRVRQWLLQSFDRRHRRDTRYVQ